MSIHSVHSPMSTRQSLIGSTLAFLIALSHISPHPMSAQTHVWSPSNDGLGSLRITCLASFPNRMVIAGTIDSGIFLSSNGGQSWQKRSSGLQNLTITSIATYDGRLIIAGSQHVGFPHGEIRGDNVVSIDSGSSWQVVSLGLPGYRFTHLAMPSETEIYGIVQYVDDLHYPSNYYLLHSSNGGSTWETLLTLRVATELLVLDSLVLVSGRGYTDPTKDLYRSTDLGHTWSALSINPGSGWTAFCVDSSGVLHAGVQWNVYESTDDGLTWLSTNGLSGEQISTLFTGADNTLFGGTAYHGLFVSTDQGETWQLDTVGMGGLQIVSMVYDSSVNYLVGTYGGGVYRSQIVTDIGGGDDFRIRQFALSVNYPNPFNPTTTIEYSVLKAGHVEIVVCDLLGRVVAVLEDRYQSPGSHSVAWRPQDMPSGIYSYTLRSNGLSETRKLLYIK